MGEKTLDKIHTLLVALPFISYLIPVSLELPLWSLTPFRVAVFALFVFSIYVVIRMDEVEFTYTDIGLMLVLIILIGSVAWSPDPKVSLARGMDIILMLLYYVSLLVYFNRNDDYGGVIQVLLLCSVAIFIYGLVELAFGDLTRGIVAYLSRNGLSRKILALLPIVGTVALVSDRPIQRRIFAAIALFMTALVPLSGSRSGLIGLVVAAFLSSILYLRYIYQIPTARLIPLGIGVISLFLASVTIALHLGGIPHRLTRIPLSPAAFSPAVLGENRYLVYEATLRTIRNHWLIGVGFEGFVILTRDVYGFGAYRAHDLISRVWMAAGIGPVVILLATLVTIVRNYVNAIANSDGTEQLYLASFFIGFVAITLAGMANIVITELLWWVFLAVGSNWIPRH